MEYSKLAKTYEKLEGTSKRLEKASIIRSLLQETLEDELDYVVLLLRGRLFPAYDTTEIGISNKLLIKAIATSTGYSPKKINDLWREKGDIGLVTEELIGSKKQNTLFSESLMVKDVFETLRSVAVHEGIGSTEKKTGAISKLLTSASGLEAKYIVRTVLKDLRVGVGEGTLRDAVSWAYLVDPNYEEGSINPDDREEYSKVIDVIQSALDKTNDFSLVARMAKKGIKELEELKLIVGKPLKVMLAQKTDSTEEAFKSVGKPAVFEYKMDGFRMQIHKDNENVSIFTRSLEEVTNQFPEVVEYVKKNVNAKTVILDGEAVGYDPKTGKYTPFQNISQRIKRKYDIDSLAKKLPIELNVFDVLLIEDKELLQKTFKERREVLEKVVKEEDKKIILIKQLVTSDEKEAVEFYEESISLGNEGLMAKNLEGTYKPGSRVGSMVKLKPSMDDLDLVITKAEWGTGKRSGWLTSFTVSCSDNEEFLEVGKVGTGLKEKKEEGLSFGELTDLLKPLIKKEEGREVVIEPKIIVAIKFEEIQKSPSYNSGYALRFPRIVNLRRDKPLNEINTLEEVKKEYEEQ